MKANTKDQQGWITLYLAQNAYSQYMRKLRGTGWMLLLQDTEEGRLDLPGESKPRPVDGSSVSLQDRHYLVLSNLDVVPFQV